MLRLRVESCADDQRRTGCTWSRGPPHAAALYSAVVARQSPVRSLAVGDRAVAAAQGTPGVPSRMRGDVRPVPHSAFEPGT